MQPFNFEYDEEKDAAQHYLVCANFDDQQAWWVVAGSQACLYLAAVTHVYVEKHAAPGTIYDFAVQAIDDSSPLAVTGRHIDEFALCHRWLGETDPEQVDEIHEFYKVWFDSTYALYPTLSRPVDGKFLVVATGEWGKPEQNNAVFSWCLVEKN